MCVSLIEDKICLLVVLSIKKKSIYESGPRTHLKLPYIKSTWDACLKYRFFFFFWAPFSSPSIQSLIPTRVLFNRCDMGPKKILKEAILRSYWKHWTRGWEETNSKPIWENIHCFKLQSFLLSGQLSSLFLLT